MRRLLGIVAILLIFAFARGLGVPTETTVAAAPVGPALPDKAALIKNVAFDYEVGKTAGGSLMVANFKFKNNNVVQVKDITVTCVHAAKSGTVIDRNTRTIYDVVKAKGGSMAVKEFNMGFIHSQAQSSGCRITDLAVAG